MIHKNRCNRRYMDLKKAERKLRILNLIHGKNPEWIVSLHALSKSKIHCTCGLCCGTRVSNHAKTRRSTAATYSWTTHRYGKNWNIADTKTVDNMDYQEREFKYAV